MVMKNGLKNKRSYEFWGSSDWILKESSIKSSCARAMRETIFAVFCWAFSAPSAGVSPSWSLSIISMNQDLARSIKFSNKQHTVYSRSQLNFDNVTTINKDYEHAPYCSHSHSSGVNFEESGMDPILLYRALLFFRDFYVCDFFATLFATFFATFLATLLATFFAILRSDRFIHCGLKAPKHKVSGE